MGFFDDDVPLESPSRQSHGEQMMAAHAAAYPQFSGPEIPQSGNRYPLPDSDGKLIIWPGATTLANELDNPYALQNWQLRQVARGMGLRSDLVAQAGACTDDDRETLREVVSEAQSAAAVSTGANLGKALHMAFERVDRGEPVENLPEMFHADIRARQEALAAHGITILPEYRERVIRCDIFKVAGRMDGIARLADGSLVVFDDKSEKDPVKYPHAKCVQIGIYTNAGILWDYNTNTPELMPDVRKDFALVIHSRPGEAKCEIYRVDIARGWAAARIAVELREWRKADGLIAPYVSASSWVPKSKDETLALRLSQLGPSGHVKALPEEKTAEESLTVCPQCEVAIPAGWTYCVACQTECEVCHEPYCPMCNQCVSGQCPRSACTCELVSQPGEPERWEPQSTTEQVTELIAKAEKPLTPAAVALLNAQASQVNGKPIPVDPEAEIIELAELTKPQLQKMCKSVGITDVAHHRKWLASEYVKARNALGMSEFQMEQKRHIQEPVPLDEPELTAKPFVDEPEPNFQYFLADVEKAMSKQELAQIWNHWVSDGNPETGEEAQQLMNAGLARLNVLKNMRPVGADNPFAKVH